MIQITSGHEFAAARQKIGFSRHALAQKLGVSEATIYRIERLDVVPNRYLHPFRKLLVLELRATGEIPRGYQRMTEEERAARKVARRQAKKNKPKSPAFLNTIACMALRWYDDCWRVASTNNAHNKNGYDYIINQIEIREHEHPRMTLWLAYVRKHGISPNVAEHPEIYGTQADLP